MEQNKTQQNKNKIWDVVIIGGGASGMMAGAIASSLGKSVLILEKNKSLGEKLKITGGGRCNITNAEFDVRKLLKHYGKGEHFLYSPFSQFGVQDTFNYFEKLGLPLVVQARNRAFPHTEKAYDVYEALNKELKKNNISIQSGTVVKRIATQNSDLKGPRIPEQALSQTISNQNFTPLISHIETNKGLIYGKSFILATGGVSHPETGSTGDGFRFLADLGHTVKEPSPTIVPLEVGDEWIKSLPGISLSFMKITFFLEDKKQFSKTGKVLFTHFGLSGPLILNSSSEVADLLQSGKVTATIDAYPDTTLGALEDNIIKIFDANKNKQFRTVFKEIVPAGTAKALETIAPFIDFETKVHSITKEDRKKIAHLLKALPVTITNLMGYDRAVVADGGVALEEIDTKTMRSKLYSNLYVTGDLLHINRPSGGYSLQLCWTTGYVAGTSA